MSHILVIEDSKADVRLIRLALAEHSVTCTLRTCGTAFELRDYVADLRAGKAEAPDLILTDLNIPGISFETLINSVRTDFEGTPIVVVSAAPRKLVEESCALEVASAIVEKTGDLDSFLKLGGVVRRLLDRPEPSHTR